MQFVLTQLEAMTANVDLVILEIHSQCAPHFEVDVMIHFIALAVNLLLAHQATAAKMADAWIYVKESHAVHEQHVR